MFSWARVIGLAICSFALTGLLDVTVAEEPIAATQQSYQPTLAYIQLTLRCANCHKFARDIKPTKQSP